MSNNHSNHKSSAAGKRNRWGDAKLPAPANTCASSRASADDGNDSNWKMISTDEAALDELLASAQARNQTKQQHPSLVHTKRSNHDNKRQRNVDAQPQRPPLQPPPEYDREYGQRSQVTDDEMGKRKRKSGDRWGASISIDSNKACSKQDSELDKPKEKANFGLSGALTEDEKGGNVYKGVVMKFKEPLEARAPMTKWRLYVFKKSSDSLEPIQTMHISKQSAYLFGRDSRVADIVVEHPSLSKQHCVLQYRALPDKKQGGKIQCKPYLMDLGSTNGTFINGQRLEEARYYEMLKKDVVTLGMSSREYVLLTG